MLGALCVVEPLKILISVGLFSGQILKLLLGLWLEKEDISNLDIQIVNDKKEKKRYILYAKPTLSKNSPS